MTKAQARKICYEAGRYIGENIFEAAHEQQQHEHGGWDEIEGEDAEAMVILGEDANATAMRDGLVAWLMSAEGLTAVKSHVSSTFDYAMEHANDEEEETDE